MYPGDVLKLKHLVRKISGYVFMGHTIRKSIPCVYIFLHITWHVKHTPGRLSQGIYFRCHTGVAQSWISTPFFFSNFNRDNTGLPSDAWKKYGEFPAGTPSNIVHTPLSENCRSTCDNHTQVRDPSYFKTHGDNPKQRSSVAPLYGNWPTTFVKLSQIFQKSILIK